MTLSRFTANLLLLLTAVIWGTAFVAQKASFAHVGPLTFIAARFAVSALVVLPFALHERKIVPAPFKNVKTSYIVLLCAAFAGAVISQQIGIGHTSVARAGFLTGLYVLFVPAIAAIFLKEKLPRMVFPAVLLSFFGVWLLSGARFSSGFGLGEWLCLLCAFGFGWQVVLIGRIMARTQAAFALSCLQYACVAVISLAGAMLFEHTTLRALLSGWASIAYTGLISGGIAYTAQTVAQRHTPASDSAVILSAESVFAALAGAVILHESLSFTAVLGCACIIAAILVLEGAPVLKAWGGRLRAPT